MKLLSSEPVLAGFSALLVAGIALLVAFGVSLTDAQIAAITGFAGAALALAALIRANVTPAGRVVVADTEAP